MTVAEAYELTTQGGTTDSAWLIKACESFGAYCLIGGLAVRLAEAYPALKSLYPGELREQINRG